MRSIWLILLFAAVALTGCQSARSARIAALPPETREVVAAGRVEPGFTPELVLLALGAPSSPRPANAETTRDAVWVYHDFHRNDRDFIRAGFRRRVVFDPQRRSDVIITEPVDPQLFPNLREHTLQVTFRNGRVVDIARIEK